MKVFTFLGLQPVARKPLCLRFARQRDPRLFDVTLEALNVSRTIYILLAKVSICSHHIDCIDDSSFKPDSKTDARKASEVISYDDINSQSTAKATPCFDKLEESIGICTRLAQSSV